MVLSDVCLSCKQSKPLGQCEGCWKLFPRSERKPQELLEGYHDSHDCLRSGTATAPTRNWSENFLLKKGIKTR